MRIVIFATIITLGVIFLSVESVFAWGPNTHLFLGYQAIEQASALRPFISSLLASYPLDFLYGSIFADMSIGKKFFMFAKYVHNWRVGFELKEAAENEKNMACAYGYLAHLAADTVSHNEFLPRKMVEYYSLLGRGHIFFEARFDSVIPDKQVHSRLKEIMEEGSANNDAFLEQYINRTIFSFNTNRRIFNSLMTLHRNNGLQVYRRYRAISKNRVSRDDLHIYLDKSLTAVLDLLDKERSAECYARDPHGKLALKTAQRWRSKLRANGSSRELYKEALEHVSIGPHRG